MLPLSNSSVGQNAPALGLYIHVPFCFHRCSYCDFFSVTENNQAFFEKYTRTILAEVHKLREYLDFLGFENRKLTSIFLGGGTPSLLPTHHLGEIFNDIEANFGFDKDIEITCEANPETISADWLGFVESETPINRISMGVQSRDAEILKHLERKCSVQAIQTAAELVASKKYLRRSADLIFGIPGQSMEKFSNDVAWASSMGYGHLSSYQLTLKPGHALFKQLPDENESCAWYEKLWETTQANGFESYEISNFSKRGEICRHNILYWKGGDFFGIGPSAASRYFSDGTFHHRKQVADLKLYIEQAGQKPIQFEKNSLESTQLEAIMLELRTKWGIDVEEFKSRYGIDIEKKSEFKKCISKGWIDFKEGKITLTPSGLILCDSIALELAL